MIEQIRAGKGDVLVVWEISRKERDLAVYVKIRDMRHEVGLYFWLSGGTKNLRIGVRPPRWSVGSTRCTWS